VRPLESCFDMTLMNDGGERDEKKRKLQRRESVSDSTRDDGACWNNFEKWALQQGAVCRGIKFAVSRAGYGRGAVALEEVVPGCTIASVPVDMALTVDRARESRQGRILLQLFEERLSSSYCMDRFILCMSLIAQRYFKDEFFHPFAIALPSSFGELPLNWTETERRSLLMGTDLYGAVEKALEDMRALFDACFPRLSLEYTDTFPAEVYTFENFVWAESAVRSRGFPGRLANSSYKECMIPCLDMFNHRRGTPIEWITTEEDGRINFKTGTNFETVASGEEVFNNYGAKGNEEFLFGYGFCIPDNPEDEVLLLISLDRVEPIRRSWIKAARIEPMFYVKRGNLVPDELLQLIRILACTDIELYLMHEKGRAPNFVSAENELASFSTLRTMLERKLQLLVAHSPTVVENIDSERTQSASLYREGRQRVLREALAHLEVRRLNTVSSRAGAFISSVIEGSVARDNDSIKLSKRFDALLRQSGGNCSVEFCPGGVFAARDVGPGEALLRIPATSGLLKVVNDDDEQVLEDWLDSHHDLIGTLVSWQQKSLLFWSNFALEQLQGNVIQSIAERREGLTTAQTVAAAIADAHTVEIEGSSRRTVVVALPRMPAVHNNASAVWEWHGDDLCLITLQPGGVHQGARVVATTGQRNATSEDLVLSHSHSFLENPQPPAFDLIALGVEHESIPSVDECLSTDPDSLTVFQHIDTQELRLNIQQLEELLMQPIAEHDAHETLDTFQRDVIQRFRDSQLAVVNNTKRLMINSRPWFRLQK
jgi:hypothetical protein